MRPELLDLLACQRCGAPFALQDGQVDGDHVVDGALRCTGCDESHPIVRGVPRMNRSMSELQDVARAFSHEWREHHEGRLESDTLFGRTEQEDWERFRLSTGLDDADVEGLVVLDAGCGPARVSRQVAERGARAVVALDMSETVEGVFERLRSIPNLHVVQGNLVDAPVRPAFDLVWSNGVIHHTPDAAAAFRALTRYVRPGGLLFVWVYPNRINPFRWTKAALDRVGLRRLSEPAVLRVARAFSYVSVVLLETYRLVRRLPGLRPRGEWAHSTVRPRSLRELQLTWNDALAPPHNSWHTDEEVSGWFRAAGFQQIVALDEPKVGVRGRAPGP